MSTQPYKYVQTIVSSDEAEEIDEYVRINKIKNKREWLKETILQEVRGHEQKSLQLHD